MKYELIKCPCGCNAQFHKSQSKPIGWKITSLYHKLKDSKTPDKILEIEREDGVKFRVGDTVERFSEMGESAGIGIIYEIQDLSVKHPFIGLRLFVHTLYSAGTAEIGNVGYLNADYPNMLRFLVNRTNTK